MPCSLFKGGQHSLREHRGVIQSYPKEDRLDIDRCAGFARTLGNCSSHSLDMSVGGIVENENFGHDNLLAGGAQHAGVADYPSRSQQSKAVSRGTNRNEVLLG